MRRTAIWERSIAGVPSLQPNFTNICCWKSQKSSPAHRMSLLAIDIGSSQCKALVFTEGGEVVARSVCPYSPVFPRPGFAEMDPEKLWDAVCKTSREVTRDQGHNPVQAVCLSSHGETFIPVNARGAAVGLAILNIDNRATREAKWFEQTI